MRSWTVSLLASALAVPALQQAPAAASQVTDAHGLLAAFAQMTGLEARFEEEKHLALLAAPLKSKGRLYFMRPGYLTRIVEGDEPSTLTITPNELKLSGQDGEERIDLRQNDAVRAFVTSLVQVFAGDEAALERSYAVAFARGAEDPEAWTLTLTPRDKPLTDMLASLTLTGRGPRASAIEVREPNGDRTLTRIVEADVERRFSPEEQRTLFGIAPP
jgi:hypothetical protein